MRAVVPKPYVSLGELSGLTPWTREAIRGMIRRRVLRCGEHYFWVGHRLVFRWGSIVELIEGGRESLNSEIRETKEFLTIPMLNGGKLVVPKT